MFRKLKLYISFIIVIALGIWYVSVNGNESAPTNADSAFSEDGSMAVSFLDVGQGDSTFINLPDGKTLLIDAANPGDGADILDFLSNKGVNRLDFVVATHPHADHIGGMAYIIENMEIGQVFAPKIYPSDVPTTKTYENFLLSVKEKGLKITAAKGGNTLFEGEGYKAECLAPNKEKNDEINDYSIVFKLTYGKDVFLFTGDATTEIEKEILNMGYNIDSDVLKIGHHGSHSSSSRKFLNEVSPEYAIISCGRDNSYGHPHGETLSALDNLEGLISLYRTDVHKTITAVSKGDGKIKFTTGGKTVVNGD
jgi:beta-lactamase superfamily II metal-dependent hydrolase